MAKPYLKGKTQSSRLHIQGQDIYRAGEADGMHRRSVHDAATQPVPLAQYASTRHIINRDTLALLPHGAIFVNTARGAG